MLHQECYCDKRFKASHTPEVFIWTTFSGSVPWGFYKEWGFNFLPRGFIQVVVLQKIPMMFLFCPCAQSGTIEYKEIYKKKKLHLIEEHHLIDMI